MGFAYLHDVLDWNVQESQCDLGGNESLAKREPMHKGKAFKEADEGSCIHID